MLYSGGITKTNFFELNHNMYNMYYYHANGLIPLKIPRKESGREIEILLFGENDNSLNINQIKYLLNENNFNKGIVEFKNGFEALKEEDLIIKGEFSYFNEVIKITNFNEFKDLTSISTDNFDEFYNNKSEDNNDVLGCY